VGTVLQELEDYPTMEQHLQRLQERVRQVPAARDSTAQDPSPTTAAEHGAADLPPPSAANALWTERFQPQQPSQACRHRVTAGLSYSACCIFEGCASRCRVVMRLRS
jgi:hypothetical protein